MIPLKNELKSRLKGKIAVLSVGNPIRGDDGFGPYLLSLLIGKVRARLFDGGSTPENYLGPIIRENPETVMVLDVAHFDGKPGEVRILEKGSLNMCCPSTHNPSPGLFMDYIKSECGADVFLLCAQPARIKLGTELSEELRHSAEKTADILGELL